MFTLVNPVPTLLLLSVFLCLISCSATQTDDKLIPPESITVYLSGNQKDVQTKPKGGIVMMGGRTEHDMAMRWFLEQANGGDVLVMRASGSDGYQDYLYKELGVTVNSVQSMVFHSSTVSEYVLDKINKAEAIWFAGGNQKLYLDYWKGNQIQTALQQAIDRGVVIGGTSAGMAILGEFIWDGERIQTDFLDISFLKSVITDTHYDARNRMERHLGFISEIEGKGIAADEYTAITIHPEGDVFVYGDEAQEDYAYFISQDFTVLKVKGETNGALALNLSDW